MRAPCDGASGMGRSSSLGFGASCASAGCGARGVCASVRCDHDRRAMATAADFRRLVLSLPEATEGTHMGHPDFRVRNKVFASLGYPDKTCGMVKLTPEQQQILLETEPALSKPAAGAWGRR